MVDMHVTKSMTNPIELTKPAKSITLTPVDHDPFIGNEGVAPAIGDAVPKAEGGLQEQGFWSKLWGNPQENTPVRVPPNTNYPDALDAHYAKQFDQTYGDEVSKFLQEGSKTKKMNVDQVQKAFGDISGRAYGLATATSTTPEERDTILKNWIAAQKSSVSAIGFDPEHTIMSPKGTPGMNLAGFYRPSVDTLWYNATDGEDVSTHESLHRGIQKLRETDMLPKSVKDQIDYLGPQGEEMLVRALKLRHFGEIEKGPGRNKGNEQVEGAKDLMENFPDFRKALDDLEDAGSKFIKQKKSYGPR